MADYTPDIECNDDQRGGFLAGHAAEQGIREAIFALPGNDHIVRRLPRLEEGSKARTQKSRVVVN